MRNVPAWGIYFSTYEYFKTNELKYNIANTYFMLAIYGGLAGVISWIPTYPMDIVKTTI